MGEAFLTSIFVYVVLITKNKNSQLTDNEWLNCATISLAFYLIAYIGAVTTGSFRCFNPAVATAVNYFKYWMTGDTTYLKNL